MLALRWEPFKIGIKKKKNKIIVATKPQKATELKVKPQKLLETKNHEKGN